MSVSSGSSVHFTDEQYEALRHTYRQWWDGTLPRPIVPIITSGHASDRAPSSNPPLPFETAWDFSIEPEQFVDRQDADLSTLRFYGEAFPSAAPTRFGAGALAAFLGCKPIGSKETVWFLPPKKDMPIEDLHFEYDESTPYFQRVLRYYEAAVDKWQGRVVVNMLDLGGVLDVLASFRGTENLLMDLYDAPEEVHRCIDELQGLWLRYFKRFTDLLAPTANGYSHWYGLYCEKPSYILQSDFCYMIGPEMFDEFVAPELASTAAQLDNAVYHMDGVGQIPHLESLLRIDAIKGYQWQPGDGEAASRNWDWLLARILDADKKLIYLTQQSDGRPISLCKNPGQLYCPTRRFDASDIDAAKAYGAIYGIDVSI